MFVVSPLCWHFLSLLHFSFLAGVRSRQIGGNPSQRVFSLFLSPGFQVIVTSRNLTIITIINMIMIIILSLHLQRVHGSRHLEGPPDTAQDQWMVLDLS